MGNTNAERDPRRAVARALRRREAETCRRELERALAAAEARGGLTPAQREVLRAFAARVSHRVLSRPLDALDADEVDPEAAATLFEV